MLPNNLTSYNDIIHYLMHAVGIVATEAYLIWFNGAC